MLKLFNRKKKNNKGFTLVELVIVIAILAILVGLLAPQYTKYVERSRQAADASNLDNLVTVVKVAAVDDKYKGLVPTGETDNVFTFIISDGGSGVYLGQTAQDDENTDIGKALAEYAGKEWRNTTLKSSRWGKNLPTGSSISVPKLAKTYISATCSISKDGSVTVAYYPDKVKNSVKES